LLPLFGTSYSSSSSSAPNPPRRVSKGDFESGFDSDDKRSKNERRYESKEFARLKTDLRHGRTKLEFNRKHQAALAAALKHQAALNAMSTPLSE